MRTPEQNVSFHEAAYLKAEAFHARMTLNVGRARIAQTDGIAYAKSALVQAQGREGAPPELLKARADLNKAKAKVAALTLGLADLEALLLANPKPASLGLQYAQQSVVDAERKHAALVQSALNCQTASAAKLKTFATAYEEAAAVVQHLARVDHAETREALRQMKLTNAREKRENILPSAPVPKVTADTELAEPPEGWAEFDRKANAEIQRKNAGGNNTTTQTDINNKSK